MESSNYLTDDESDNHCENNEESDQRNVLIDPEKLVNFDGHCYAEIKISPSDWIKMEANPGNNSSQVNVDSHEDTSSLVESIMLAIEENDSFRIKLSLNRDSIKFLRRSLKTVEGHLEPAQSTTECEWKSKVDSFMKSIQIYNKTDHQSSTDGSKSRIEAQMSKQFARETNTRIFVDENDDQLAKRIPYCTNRFENFWFYPRNLIENGKLQVQNFPRTLNLTNIDHIKRRLEESKKVNPDPYTFAHVQHKEPWDESDSEQLLVPKIPKEIVKRVLKGMSRGKLYNIDYPRLSKIFGGLIYEDAPGKVKCPLCARVYACRASCIDHFESIHTNFAVFCGHCGHFFLRTDTVKTHKCSADK